MEDFWKTMYFDILEENHKLRVRDYEINKKLTELNEISQTN